MGRGTAFPRHGYRRGRSLPRVVASRDIDQAAARLHAALDRLEAALARAPRGPAGVDMTAILTQLDLIEATVDAALRRLDAPEAEPEHA